VLEVSRLSFSYAGRHGPVPILKDISFSVPRGGAYGVIGESGSGKSTLLRLLSGLARPVEGQILVDGAPAVRWSGKMRRRVQFVMQDPYASLHPLKTINSALGEPLRIHGERDIPARVEKALAQVGLDASFRFRFPHQLSGGQRQRVAIARALIINPEIVLLDEPTSALDVSVQAEVLNLLKDLQEERQLTFVLVSHDLAVVAHMCDRASVLHSGSIVETLEARDLRAGNCSHPYSKELMASARVGLPALEVEQ
jgi:peptide/nickel transport system ATP-binding protein